MADQTKYFAANSKDFIAHLVIAGLAIFAALGVSFPQNVDTLGPELVTAFSTSGVYALFGVFLTAVAMPVYNWVRKGQKVDFLRSVISDPNTVTYLVAALFSGLALLGINIPSGAAQNIVSAVFARDWSALVAIIFSAVLQPVWRFFVDRKAAGKV